MLGIRKNAAFFIYFCIVFDSKKWWQASSIVSLKICSSHRIKCSFKLKKNKINKLSGKALIFIELKQKWDVFKTKFLKLLSKKFEDFLSEMT